MGRRDSKYKQKYFSAEKEKERNRKIKESVLKVFRARLKEPEKNEESSSDSSSGVTSESEGKDMNNVSRHTSKSKIRRRKTRSQRNKIRTGGQKTKSHQTEHSALQSHMKKLEKISRTNLSSHESDPKVCAISQSRLTRKLGLFNQAKKSHTVVREPIILSESVRRKTDADLRKILNLSDTGLADSVKISNLIEEYENNTSPVQDVNIKKTPQNISTPHSVHSNKSQKSNEPLVIKIESEDEPSSHSSFPSSPALSDIALNFKSVLKVRKVFASLNYERETQEDLYRLLKQNAPLKPCPSVVSSVAQSIKSVMSEPTRSTQINKLPRSADVVPITLQSSCPLPTSAMMPRLIASAVNDARSLLYCNEKAMMSREQSSKSDYAASQSSQQSYHSNKHSNSQEMSSDVQTEHHNVRMDVDEVFHSKNHSRTHINKQQGTVQPYPNYPLYMPGIHDNIHHNQTFDGVQRKTGIWDVLDFIDLQNKAVYKPAVSHKHVPQTQPSPRYGDLAHRENSAVDMRVFTAGHLTSHENKSYVTSSPDMDTSPPWCHRPPPPLTKPSVATPSPPEKLYPRKLF